MTDARLLPSPNTGTKYAMDANSNVVYETFASNAEIQ